MANITVFGNTYISAICTQALLDAGHCVIGYIPNVSAPTVPGVMPVPMIGGWAGVCERTDFALSIQYDRQIPVAVPAYNLHTGLLPDWGGMDILYHTIRLKATEQGLTFHRITSTFDGGPILSRVTYPVLLYDTTVDLYGRMAAVAPGFLVAAVNLLLDVGHAVAMACPSFMPRMFRRGQVQAEDLAEYYRTAILLRERFA